MKVVVFNLGCKVNQYESDLIIQEIKGKGHTVSDQLEYADVYIINTCAVTAEAERKSRQAVARCKKFNPNSKILVCGCASQKSPKSFEKENVTYITGIAKKVDIINEIDRLSVSNNVQKLPTDYEYNPVLKETTRIRAYVKIQDGCNNFCSYCIIPYLRGRSRSRKIEDVVSEVKQLSKITKEIVLTGINFVQYGEDIGVTLTDLIDSLKDFDVRIRLGSFYVEALNEKLLESLFSLKNFCPHFHLSLQSGDDSVLKSMNRKYTTDLYYEKIELIRKFDKNASITTDIIVGFPTETEECFYNTLNFLKRVKFADIHVFPFSAREGTKAYLLPKIEKDVILKRRDILLELKKDFQAEYLDKNINVNQCCLMEEKEGEFCVGHSKNYIKVYSDKVKIGEIGNIIPSKKYKQGLK